MNYITKAEPEYLSDLRERGFGVIKDGSGVIVIGKPSEIPIDRPVGAFDLLSPTRARRFDSAKAAVFVLDQVNHITTRRRKPNVS